MTDPTDPTDLTNRSKRVASRGHAVINDPETNRGTAFTPEERRALKVDGLLPAAVETIDEQLARQHRSYERLSDDLARHIFLRNLQDSNEVLYYRFLGAHLEDVLPIVYTPTVGAACQRFSEIYRRPHGVFVSYPDRDRIAEQFDAIMERIDVIVVTDGERILGLGDQGVGGMGIPIGKLALYTAAGGIDPVNTLPVVLDVGTNNADHLADPLYLGWRNERIRDADYDAFVKAFVETVTTRFPGVLLQWEDFAGRNAAPILDRYRSELLSFNDDIQGTAAVALGAIDAAVRSTGSTLAAQRLCVVGAGSAGLGIAAMMRDAMSAEGVDNSRSRIFLTDRHGLLTDDRQDLSIYQRPFAQPADSLAAGPGSGGPRADLASIVATIQPTVLIGVSGAGGIFTEDVIRAMAKNCDRPIVMPMSNPTSKAEAIPADVLGWTSGRAVVATGSPFDPVAVDGRTVTISQANNVYVFPGVGLGAIIAEASAVTDDMLVAAAGALAACAPDDVDDGILPPIPDLIVGEDAVSRQVAMAVARAAIAGGVAPARTNAELRVRIAEYWWTPSYPTLITD